LALLNHGKRLKDNFSLPTLEKINCKLTVPISEREYDLLCKIFEGLTTKQMAEQLFIAVSTVKTHIRNIYLKLDVINRSGAIARIREIMLR
jgi:LuxR family maltose regulon positive regulatory protein